MRIKSINLSVSDILNEHLSYTMTSINNFTCCRGDYYTALTELMPLILRRGIMSDNEPLPADISIIISDFISYSTSIDADDLHGISIVTLCFIAMSRDILSFVVSIVPDIKGVSLDTYRTSHLGYRCDELILKVVHG